MALQHLRSNTASKRPLASGLSDGQIAVNTNETSPGLFFKGASGAVLKVGPVHVGNSAPNSSPATGGSTGNSVGEQWLDTSNSGFVFKIWDGTDWRSETGEFVDVTGDTMTGNLTISGADLVMNNGEIIAASGAEATPSITFDGDLDTGFYKPAADKLAISTGGTSRVIIDDNGQVGIGTASPTQKLQLQTSNSNCYLRTNDGTVDGYFGVSNASSALQVYTASSSPIQFITNNSEAARITSAGNVGIGTTLPGSPLTVESSVSQLVLLESTTPKARIKFVDSTSTNGSFIAGDGNELIFETNGNNERLRINSAGNVGIGTSAPVALLTSSKAVSGGEGGAIAIQNASAGVDTTAALYLAPNTGAGNNLARAASIVSRQTTSGNFADLEFSVSNGANPAEAMRIDSSGNVGIGTTSPGALLEVRDTANSEIRISDTAGGYGNLVYNESGTVSVFEISADPANTSTPNTELRFSVDGSRVITCLNSGNVGIGTTDPQAALDINAAASTSPFIASINSSEAARIDSSGRLLVGTSNSRITGFGIIPKVQIEGVNAVTDAAQAITLNRTDNLGPRFVFAKSKGNTLNSNTIVAENDELGNIYFCGADGTDISTVGAAITANVDGTPGENDMPSRLVFSTTADGASTPTERMRISQDGRIRYFSSSATIFEAASSSAAGTTNFIFVGKNAGTAIGTGTSCVFIYSNGDLANNNNVYGAISDIKLKENIVDASSQWDDLKALQVRNYNFKEGQTHTQIGLVAQEVELVSPGLVSETPDRDDEGNDLGTVTKSVNYSVLYMKAVKALQEAMERIETLEQRLTDAGL